MEHVNILLVDDQPGKLLAYEAILEGLDANLIKATTSEEALSLLLRTEIAVILMDVCMPGLDGFELAEMIRGHPRHEKTAIIFISAVRLETEDLLRGYRTGAVDYVPVPVVPEILKAKVQIFVELFRKTRQLDVLNTQLEERVQQRAEQLEQSHALLQQSEERLRLASEAAHLATFEYDMGGNLAWSENVAELLHVKGSDVARIEAFIGSVQPEDREAAEVFFRSLSGATSTAEAEFRVITARGIAWVLARARAFVTADAHTPRVLGTLLDITDRKMAENHQQLLMAELDHRVKNILANVAAIARLSSASANSVDTFVSALDGRIQSMSAAHDLLRQSSWTGVNMYDLVAGAMAPYRSKTQNEIVIQGERVRLTSKFAQSMALVMHELATNAVKHGALSQERGSVIVAWTRSGNGNAERIRFTWTERNGPACANPARKGFGLAVIRSAALECGGHADMRFTSEGFEFNFEGDLTARTHLVTPRHISVLQQPRSPAPADPDQAEHEASSLRILLIEDEALIALQLKEDLEADGNIVIGPFARLAEGLAAAEGTAFDIAILDINLGIDNSAPIAEILDGRGVPFAFTTGYNDLIFLPPRLRQYPHLTKPYNMSEVKELVQKLKLRAQGDAEAGTSDKVARSG